LAENCEFFLPHPCLTPPFRGNPFEFLDETYPAKTRGMGLLCGENSKILTSAVFAWITRVTDRRTDGRNCDSICALTACMLSRATIGDAYVLQLVNILSRILFFLVGSLTIWGKFKYLLNCVICNKLKSTVINTSASG